MLEKICYHGDLAITTNIKFSALNSLYQTKTVDKLINRTRGSEGALKVLYNRHLSRQVCCRATTVNTKHCGLIHFLEKRLRENSKRSVTDSLIRTSTR